MLRSVKVALVVRSLCGMPVVLVSVAGLSILRLGCSDWCKAAVVHRGSGHTSLVRVTTNRCSSSELSIAGTLGSLVALPKLATAAGGVVVLWAGAITLLLLMVLHNHELPASGDEEQEDAENGNGKDSGVQAARIAEAAGTWCALVVQASTDGCVDDAAAGICAMAGVVGDGSKCSSEADIKEDAQETEETMTSEAKTEDDAKNGVESSCANDSLDSLLPCWDCNVVSREHREEVGVNAEGDGSTTKFEDAQANEAEAQNCTADCHGVSSGVGGCCLRLM